MLSVIMLSVVFYCNAECHYAECRYTECHYAVFYGAASLRKTLTLVTNTRLGLKYLTMTNLIKKILWLRFQIY